MTSKFNIEHRAKMEQLIRRQYVNDPELMEKKLKDWRKIWWQSDQH